MNIVHIGNTGFVASYIAKGQRDMGHDSKVYETHPFNVYTMEGTDGVIGGKIRPFSWRYDLLKRTKNADIVHWHSACWTKYLLKYIQAKTKVIFHAHGTEAREKKYFYATPNDKVILSTPDLQKNVPWGIHIPNPHPKQKIPRRFTESFKVVHGHATVYSPQNKGTEGIRKSLMNLDWMDYSEITGVPHDIALYFLSSANVAIDQMVLGVYGMFAIEAMYMGIPTLGGVNHEWENPLINVDYKTLPAFCKILKEQPILMKYIGDKQKKFVLNHHSFSGNIKRITSLYEERTVTHRSSLSMGDGHEFFSDNTCSCELDIVEPGWRSNLS